MTVVTFARLAERGGFAGIEGRAKRAILSYWQANGLDEGGKIVGIKDSDRLIARMVDLAAKMAEHFGTAGTAYPAVPWPAYGPYFNDYEHLERVAEWSTAGAGE